MFWVALDLKCFLMMSLPCSEYSTHFFFNDDDRMYQVTDDTRHSNQVESNFT